MFSYIIRFRGRTRTVFTKFAMTFFIGIVLERKIDEAIEPRTHLTFESLIFRLEFADFFLQEIDPAGWKVSSRAIVLTLLIDGKKPTFE